MNSTDENQKVITNELYNMDRSLTVPGNEQYYSTISSEQIDDNINDENYSFSPTQRATQQAAVSNYEVPQTLMQQQETRPNETTLFQQQQQQKVPSPQHQAVNKGQLVIIIMLALILVMLGALLILAIAILGQAGNNVPSAAPGETAYCQTSTEMLSDVVEELKLLNESFLLNILQPISCKYIKSRQPNSPTGYYHIYNRDVFCNMGELCGSGGGWTRLAYLNMTDDTENCPSGFELYEEGGVRACGRPISNSGGCSSVKFPSNGISYSEICGRVVGYQYRSTDGIISNNINAPYVDGVSITHGSPRQHVWTLMAGWSESGTNQQNCPCNSNPPQSVPSLISSHYYCESGNPGSNSVWNFFPSDPLWDGEGCDGNESPCCSSPDLPWFHRDYGNTTTTDFIELRVCGDQSTYNEDAPVGLYEIYVK